VRRGGIEHGGVLLGRRTLAHIAPLRGYRRLLPPLDASLARHSRAIDRGARIAGVTSGFAGRGPDLGALERGRKRPRYGIR
jgi:hypothetical protein